MLGKRIQKLIFLKNTKITCLEKKIQKLIFLKNTRITCLEGKYKNYNKKYAKCIGHEWEWKLYPLPLPTPLPPLTEGWREVWPNKASKHYLTSVHLCPRDGPWFFTVWKGLKIREILNTSLNIFFVSKPCPLYWGQRRFIHIGTFLLSWLVKKEEEKIYGALVRGRLLFLQLQRKKKECRPL